MAFDVKEILKLTQSLNSAYFYVSIQTVLTELSSGEASNEDIAKLFVHCVRDLDPKIRCEDSLKGFLSYFQGFVYSSTADFNKGRDLMDKYLTDYAAEIGYISAFSGKSKNTFKKLMEHKDFKRGWNIGKSESNFGLSIDESPDLSEGSLEWIQDITTMHSADLIARIREEMEGRDYYFCDEIVHAAIKDNIEIWQGEKEIGADQCFEDLCFKVIEREFNKISNGQKSDIQQINDFAATYKTLQMELPYINDKTLEERCGIKNVDPKFIEDLDKAIEGLYCYGEFYGVEPEDLYGVPYEILEDIQSGKPVSQIYNHWKYIYSFEENDIINLNVDYETFDDLSYDPTVWGDKILSIADSEDVCLVTYKVNGEKATCLQTGEEIVFNEESLRNHFTKIQKTVTHLTPLTKYPINVNDNIDLTKWLFNKGDQLIIEGQTYTIVEVTNSTCKTLIHENTNTSVSIKDVTAHATKQNKKTGRKTDMAKDGKTVLQTVKDGYKGAFKIGSVRGAIRFTRKKLIAAICDYIAVNDEKAKTKALKNKIREGAKAFLESEFGNIIVTAAMAELINNFGTTVGLKEDMVEAASMILREEVVADGTEKLAEFGFSVGKLAKGFVAPILGDLLKLQDQDQNELVVA